MARVRLFGSALAAAATLIAGPALAQDKSPPDQRGYSVFRPVPDDKLRDLCIDRPTKGTSACTVDAGRWQLEADLFSGTFQRQHGVTTEDWLVANPTVKLGLTDRIDVEANLPLVQLNRTHDRAAGAERTVAGIGDLTLRSKLAVHGNAGSPLAVVVAPFLTLPTARAALSSGAVQGGVLLPVSASLPADWSLNVTPEVDVLKDAEGGGRHAQLAGSVGLTHAVGPGLSGSVEVWAQHEFEPAGAVTQASFDLGLAYVPKRAPNLQLDVGVNVGLTRDTPGAQVYAGVARRF